MVVLIKLVKEEEKDNFERKKKKNINHTPHSRAKEKKKIEDRRTTQNSSPQSLLLLIRWYGSRARSPGITYGINYYIEVIKEPGTGRGNNRKGTGTRYGNPRVLLTTGITGTTVCIQQF